MAEDYEGVAVELDVLLARQFTEASDDHYREVKPADCGDDFTRYYLDCDGACGYQELEEKFAEILGEMFDLFKRKQKSYGPRNISAFGERGVVMRMNDKIQRLIRLVWEGQEEPLKFETIQDTYLDMAVYAVIALLLREGGWPE